MKERKSLKELAAEGKAKRAKEAASKRVENNSGEGTKPVEIEAADAPVLTAETG